MVTATILFVVGLFAVLISAVVIQNKRRRVVREATLNPGITRGGRREVLREQLAQDRKAQAQYKAERPYYNNIGGGDIGGF